MDLACVAHVPQLLPANRFVRNGTTRVFNDFLMIPKADVNDAAFHFKSALRACSPLCLIENFSCHLRPPSLASIRVTHPMMTMDEVRVVKIHVHFNRRPAPSIEIICSQRLCCG